MQNEFDRQEVSDVVKDWTDFTRDQRGPEGYAYCAGFLESTLVDALMDLSRHDMERAEVILKRFMRGA